MKNNKILLFFSITFLSCAQPIAQGPRYRINSDYYNADITVIVPEGNNQKLKKVKKIAVFFSGNDSLLARVMEDLTSAKLLDLGLDVRERTKIENILFKQMVVQQNRDDSQKNQNILNIIKVGKVAELDAVLTGSIIEGKQQYRIFDKSGLDYGAEEKLVVTSIYIQLIDIDTEKIILAIVVDYKKGRSVPKAASDIVNTLKTKIF